MNSVNDYYIHEALDRCNLMLGFVESSLSDHPAIKANKAWEEKSMEAYKALFELYQMIGKEHLK